MRSFRLFVVMFVLVACTPATSSKPVPPAEPTASAAPSATVDPVPPIVESGAPAPSAAPAEERAWTQLDPERWATVLPGRWVGADKGDAIPGGPLGGVVVDGGARVIFVRARAGSKTPWNMTFWLPGVGHLEAGTISGGCGFYETGKAFCRGYGIKGSKAEETLVSFDVSTDGQLRLQVPLSVMPVIVRLVQMSKPGRSCPPDCNP